jgi:hypothetical protein
MIQWCYFPGVVACTCHVLYSIIYAFMYFCTLEVICYFYGVPYLGSAVLTVRYLVMCIAAVCVVLYSVCLSFVIE